MTKWDLPTQIDFSGATQEERVYQNAVERVRLAHAAAGGGKLFVAYSGGKDSTVLWAIVCEAAERDGVPIGQYAERHYHITGVDPPELIYHMRRHCPDLVWDMYRQSMWRLIERKGPPTRVRRWCCEKLKEHGGEGRMCCTGVRWAESVRRAATRAAYEVLKPKRADNILLNDNDAARQTFEACVLKNMRVCNPIVDWTDANVWDYIRDRGLPYCGLYDEGFDRLGCIGCPMAGDGRKAEFARWPKFKQMYIRAFDRLVQRRAATGKPLIQHSGQEVYDWWMGKRPLDTTFPGQMGWEDLEDEDG